MKYNIIDNQLSEYYEENLTLEEAKECAIRFMERSILEQGELSSEGQRDNMRLLNEIMQDKSEADVAESLALFDYELERVE